MGTQSRKRSEVLVARSKRTSERYPLRLSHLTGANSNRAAEDGHVGSFHYLTRDKTIVCRCNRSSHLNCRQVHNAEVEKLCYEFFLKQPTETTCSRGQWRAVDTRTTKAPRSLLTPEQSEYLSASGGTYSRRDLFEYDSPSVIKLLAARDRRSLDSASALPRPVSSQRPLSSRPLSFDTVDMRHLSNGPNGEVDVPENVWRVSRPSVYLSQHNTGSLTSTPLGSSVNPVQKDNYVKPVTLAQAADPHSTLDSWYGLAHSPSPSVVDSLYEMPHNNANRVSQRSRHYHTNGFDIADLHVSFSETSRHSAHGSVAATVISDHVVELPSSRTAVELDVPRMHSPSHHSPTLRELEGRSVKYVGELDGRTLTSPPIVLKARCPSYRLSRLVSQPSSDVDLPCQEGIFLKSVQICSCPPAGDCSLCQNLLDMPKKRTIRLTCGHYTHQKCLLTSWRVLDLEFGNCPVCGMALCERTLQDRIDTDREAIFGQSFTNLQVEERIEFLSQGQIVVCWSEEEVAAAQLRLLKDYVDYHADELYTQWRQTGLEPDWHDAVVAPVIRLFKGWNVSRRKCKYFADSDCFYRLVVWAELVCLMNTIGDGMKRVQGEGTPFPSLSALHRRFMAAKIHYESEEKTWPTDRYGALKCDLVAQDAFTLAISTHAGREG
jgi:hypothetical protein